MREIVLRDFFLGSVARLVVPPPRPQKATHSDDAVSGDLFVSCRDVGSLPNALSSAREGRRAPMEVSRLTVLEDTEAPRHLCPHSSPGQGCIFAPRRKLERSEIGVGDRDEEQG
jgi:hypothetical protein